MIRKRSVPRAVLGALALVLSLSACSRTVEDWVRRMVPHDEDVYARSQLAALAQGRTQDILGAMAPEVRTDSTPAALAAMVAQFHGASIRGMELIGYQAMNFNGIRTRSLSYQMRLSDGWAVGSVASRTEGGAHVITEMTVERVAQPLEVANAFTLTGRSAVHWLVLLFTAVIPLFMLYAVSVALRMPGRRWPWVLACLVGVGTFRLNWTTGQTAFSPANFQLLGVGFLRSSMYAPWIFSVSFPLGALWVLMVSRRRRAQSGVAPVTALSAPAEARGEPVGDGPDEPRTEDRPAP